MAGKIGNIILLLNAAAPIVKDVLNKLPQKPEPTDILMAVPDLYVKGFPLTLEQATKKLLSEGFGVITSKIALNEAQPKYRECIDTQVVDSRPKSRKKVKPGTTVIVRYVTQDVIDESKRIFVEHKQNRVEIRAQKAAAWQGKIDKAKRNVVKMFAHQGKRRKKHERE